MLFLERVNELITVGVSLDDAIWYANNENRPSRLMLLDDDQNLIPVGFTGTFKECHDKMKDLNLKSGLIQPT